MESGKRCKNFTEREKMLLTEVAKEFISIIDIKKTDGTSVEAKKQAWVALTHKYNAVSETGARTEKQLHAFYDNVKKKAKKNISDDKSEMYKTGGGGTFIRKTSEIDEQVVALLPPQFNPLPNNYDSSAPYYNTCEDVGVGTSEDIIVTLDPEEHVEVSVIQATPKLSPLLKDTDSTPKRKKICLTEEKKRNINKITTSLINRKNKKQLNEDVLTNKKLEILEIQHQREMMMLEKTRVVFNLEIELKQTLLESAKLDLEIKKKNCNK